MVIVGTSEETAPTAPKDLVAVGRRTVVARATIDVRVRPARTGVVAKAAARDSGANTTIDVETTVDPIAPTADVTTTVASVGTTCVVGVVTTIVASAATTTVGTDATTVGS